MLSFFLGAGFSKFAFNLPLGNELFDFKIDVKSEKEKKKLELIKLLWNKWKEVDSSNNPEAFVAWSLKGSSHTRNRVIWYVTRRLSEPFITNIRGGLSALMIDEKAARENEKIIELGKFFSFFLESGLLAGIVTSNYDILVECALGTKKFNYGISDERLHGRGKNPTFPWQNIPVCAEGTLPLAKLHGSLSWHQDGTKWTSGKPGKNGKALIVPPAPEKHPPKALEETWQLGSKILCASHFLVIFGFAFNEYDEALLKLLKDNAVALKHVILIDINPNIKTSKLLWPDVKIDTINPVGISVTALLEKLKSILPIS